jgi:hypothetical protein
MRRNTRKLRSKKLRGGSLTSLASSLTAGTPFDMSKMGDVVTAIKAVTDSLKNAPQLLQSFQDKIKADILTLIGSKTKEITATAVSAATAAATTAAAAAAAGNLDAMQQKIKDAANLAAAEAAKLSGGPGKGEGEGEGEGEGDGEGDNSNAENTNQGSNAGPINDGSNAEYPNENSNAQYNTTEGEEFGGGGRKKRASRYPNNTRRNRNY